MTSKLPPSVRMVVVLSAISVFSGIALGGMYGATHEIADNNILKFKKIPAVAAISEAVSGPLDDAARTALEEKLLAAKKSADLGAKEPTVLFVVEKDGKPHAVALEGFGQGFGGELGVMAGFSLETGDLVGIGVTTMSETPGIGTRAKEPAFAAQFAGMKKDAVIKVKKDGGVVDAISGATISSRAVAAAVDAARTTYQQNEAAIRAAIGQ